ncbi:MAG TPA: aldehyde dehydrogenase family protein [Gaiellaceae bacterium]|jgi:glyceraldehyde-3-phosphate dehydrogenase (NADP+)|nr:aldehyde dehydrogenase family protein [Gaiellaceae bacterium]
MSTTERLRASSAEPRERIGGDPLLGAFHALVGGSKVETGRELDVRSPWDGALVGVVHRAGPDEIESAIASAASAFETTRRLSSWEREAVLEGVASAIAERREDLARAISLEGGKPLKHARLEADRAAFAFRIAAEEAKRIYGEIVPLDWIPGSEGRVAHVRRVPLGPVAGITPFNFPLMLVAHKIAPALAAGNPIVVRPASQTPIAALRLAELVLEAGWPAEGISVVPSTTDAAAPLVEDDRIKLLTFTGSPAVGWALKARAGRKRVTLELGGNAPVIVDRDVDPAYAAERIAWGATVQSGQSCISVQRVYVHDALWDEVVPAIVERMSSFAAGDPLEEATDVGPLVDEAAAERVEAWVREAVAGGARVLCGGEREGTLWQPTVLADVEETMQVACGEVFAPLLAVFRFEQVEDAIAAAGSGDFGLQAGLFTNDLRVVDLAFEEIETGGVMVNDVPTFRVDHMPYGGIKESGFGREGPRYAIEEMTEMKLVTFNRRPL